MRSTGDECICMLWLMWSTIGVWGFACLWFGVCLSFVVYRLLFGVFELIERFERFKQILAQPIQLYPAISPLSHTSKL
jgi:hypothetical protein